MKLITLVFTSLFFILSNSLVLIRRKETNELQNKERKLTNVLTHPLERILQHNKDYVKELEKFQMNLDEMKTIILSQKKDIYKDMDKVLTNFITEHKSNNDNIEEENEDE